jgi:hypothetical protein
MRGHADAVSAGVVSAPNAYELPIPFGYDTQADDPISRMARLQYVGIAAASLTLEVHSCRPFSLPTCVLWRSTGVILLWDISDIQAAGCFNPANALDPVPGASQLQLPTGEHVTCIAWSGVYFITGTDIGQHLEKTMF